MLDLPPRRPAPIAWLIASLIILSATVACRGSGADAAAPSTPPGAGAVDGGAGSGARAPIGPPRLRSLQVANRTPADALPGRQTLGSATDERFRHAFKHDAGFEPVAHAEPVGCDGSVFYEVALQANGRVTADPDVRRGQAMLAVDARIRCVEADAREATFAIDLELARRFGEEGLPPDAMTALRELVERAAPLVATGLAAQREVRHGSDDAVLAALGGDRAGALMEAASEAGERQLTRAAPRLSELTAHAEEQVALRAAAALGNLARAVTDPSTREGCVRALGAMTRGSDLERHRVAIFALGDFGGSRAGRMLESLAVGHPDARLRELARSVADRLEGGR